MIILKLKNTYSSTLKNEETNKLYQPIISLMQYSPDREGAVCPVFLFLHK